MQFQIAALVAATFAGLTSAYTQPVGPQPIGNPTIHPALGELVPVGQPYEVSWNPTTPGTVTILLLNGPSTNIQVLYPIVEKIANTGKYTWTPKTDLKPDTTHYGLQIIVDATGQYQYTPQFGIKNDAYSASSSAPASAAPSSGSASAPPTYTSSAAPVSSTSCSTSTAPATTTPCTTSTAVVVTTGAPAVYTTSVVVPVSSAWSNSTITTVAKPTVSATGTTSSIALPTGAAGRVAANAAAAFAGLGAIAMLVL